jgi:hypothetical protein
VRSIAADGRWAVAVAEHPGRPATGVSGLAQRGAIKRSLHTIAALLDDVVTLVLLIWLFPLVILVVGAPVALLVRTLYEIVKRL